MSEPTNLGLSVCRPHVQDGPFCPGCGLANYCGMCPHCRGDQEAYERELVPPFPSSLPYEAESWGTPIEHEPEHIPDVPPDWERP